MKKQDTRSLSIQEQELLRRRLVALVEEDGVTVTGAARTVGVNRRTATMWLKRYRSGRGGLTQQRRGRRAGEKRRMTATQEREVRRIICKKVPTEVGLPSYALWTRDAIAELIAQRYGIRLAVRPMGLYLSRWGFTPQRPLRHAYERDQMSTAP